MLLTDDTTVSRGTLEELDKEANFSYIFTSIGSTVVK